MSALKARLKSLRLFQAASLTLYALLVALRKEDLLLRQPDRILELGGKSPAVVDETANLEVAARKIVVGKFLNAGQICIAPDYILLSHAVAPKFISILQKQIQDLWAAGTNVNDLGRIVNDFHMQRLCSLIKDHQGNVIMGNPKAHTDGNLTPTLIMEPSPDSPLM